MIIKMEAARFNLKGLLQAVAKGRRSEFDGGDLGPYAEFLIDGKEPDETALRQTVSTIVRALTKDARSIFMPFCGPNVDGSAHGVDGNNYSDGHEDTVEGCILRITGKTLECKSARFVTGGCTPPVPPKVEPCRHSPKLWTGIKTFVERFRQ